VILGSAELAMAKLPDNHPAVTPLKHIQSAGDRAKETVWRLVHFSQTGDQAPHPIAAALVIEAQIAQLQSRIQPGKIKIIRHLSDKCRPLLKDSEDLRIIMENLLNNAVESFFDGRGVIEVVLETVAARDIPALRNAHPPQYTFGRLVVRDNGRGIEPTDLDRIFDPYFTTKNFAGGAGLGLSVVHGIVSGNSGVITVDSKVGRGTEISLFFPVAGASEARTDSSIEKS
jgi:signal transduction histidine kinase